MFVFLRSKQVTNAHRLTQAKLAILLPC